MDEDYKIVYIDKPEWGVIGGGISEFNKQQAGDDKGQKLWVVLQILDQEFVGGVTSATF